MVLFSNRYQLNVFKQKKENPPACKLRDFSLYDFIQESEAAQF